MRLSAPSLSSFYFPSLALIFTASFSGLHARMPEGSKTFIASPSLCSPAFHSAPLLPFTSHGDSPPGWDARVCPSLGRRVCGFHPDRRMDSDSDSPFNYSWPSFPRMKIRRRASRQGRSRALLFISPEPGQAPLYSYPFLPCSFARLFLDEVRVCTCLYKTLTM